MADVKDGGREFHWSRPRIIGLIFAVMASPALIVGSWLGQDVGTAAWLMTCAGLTIAYVRPTRFRRTMQRLVPAAGEQQEKPSNDSG